MCKPVPTVELATEPTAEVHGLVAELEATLSAEYPPEQRHGLNLTALLALVGFRAERSVRAWNDRIDPISHAIAAQRESLRAIAANLKRPPFVFQERYDGPTCCVPADQDGGAESDDAVTAI